MTSQPLYFQYNKIVSLLSAPDETEEEEEERCATLEELVVVGTLEDQIRQATINYEDISVADGWVYVKDEPVHNSLTGRILDLAVAGLPYDPFVRFLANLSENPSEESRNALFDFLEQGRFPLTDDGCFLGYKGVTEGMLTDENGNRYRTLVDHHTRSIDMSPGSTPPAMDWDEVDNNRNNACGRGYHVGTLTHARGFGHRMVVVKVNPRDCVSVPTSDTTKLRCRLYTVVNEFEDAASAKQFARPVYQEDEYEADDWESADREYEEEQHLAAPEPELDPKEVEEERLRSLGRDDLCREAASQGFFLSTNEARWAGKDFVLATMLAGSFPFDVTPMAKLRELAVKRRVLTTQEAVKVESEALRSLLRQSLADSRSY